MAFAITEPDAGSNSHQITTTARRDGDGWVLSGGKVYISGVDEAEAVLVVGRTEDAKTGKLKPALFIVPTDAPGFEYQPIEMDIVSPDKQFMLFLDDVRLPARRAGRLGGRGAAAAVRRAQPGAHHGRVVRDRHRPVRAGQGASRTRRRGQVWSTPIGAHQGVAHPLAQAKIQLELAKLMTQKAAALYDAGDDLGAGEAANMAKYAAAEASHQGRRHRRSRPTAATAWPPSTASARCSAAARVNRIAPVSREMILNFVAQHTLGLPKSY